MPAKVGLSRLTHSLPHSLTHSPDSRRWGDIRERGSRSPSPCGSAIGLGQDLLHWQVSTSLLLKTGLNTQGSLKSGSTVFKMPHTFSIVTDRNACRTSVLSERCSNLGTPWCGGQEPCPVAIDWHKNGPDDIGVEVYTLPRITDWLP